MIRLSATVHVRITYMQAYRCQNSLHVFAFTLHKSCIYKYIGAINTSYIFEKRQKTSILEQIYNVKWKMNDIIENRDFIMWQYQIIQVLGSGISISRILQHIGNNSSCPPSHTHTRDCTLTWTCMILILNNVH